MKILPASPKHLPHLMHLFGAVVTHQNDQNIFHWSDQYPNQPAVEADLADTWLAIGEQQHLLGTLCLNNHADPEYQEINWKHPEEDYLIVHRLAVHPKMQGKGIARHLMAFAEGKANSLYKKAVRLDTFSKNPQALRFYEKLGYQKVGEFYFPTHDSPFLAMEKEI